MSQITDARALGRTIWLRSRASFRIMCSIWPCVLLLVPPPEEEVSAPLLDCMRCRMTFKHSATTAAPPSLVWTKAIIPDKICSAQSGKASATRAVAFTVSMTNCSSEFCQHEVKKKNVGREKKGVRFTNHTREREREGGKKKGGRRFCRLAAPNHRLSPFPLP